MCDEHTIAPGTAAPTAGSAPAAATSTQTALAAEQELHVAAQAEVAALRTQLQDTQAEAAALRTQLQDGRLKDAELDRTVQQLLDGVVLCDEDERALNLVEDQLDSCKDSYAAMMHEKAALLESYAKLVEERCKQNEALIVLLKENIALKSEQPSSDGGSSWAPSAEELDLQRRWEELQREKEAVRHRREALQQRQEELRQLKEAVKAEPEAVHIGLLIMALQSGSRHYEQHHGKM